MEQLTDSEAAVLIDAMCSGAELGTIRRFDARHPISAGADVPVLYPRHWHRGGN
jgi:hypothetical protein